MLQEQLHMRDLFGDQPPKPPSPYNGEPPHQQHSDTSKDAAESIKRAIGPLHVKVLTALAETGGSTDEELCNRLSLGGNTLRPRRRELELMKRVKDSGHRRNTASGRAAVIWEIAS